MEPINIGIILGLYCGYIGIVDKKMETTTVSYLEAHGT